MSTAKKILVLAPTAAEQARASELVAALESTAAGVTQMIIDGNYDRVLDALTEAVVPVVVK